MSLTQNVAAAVVVVPLLGFGGAAYLSPPDADLTPVCSSVTLRQGEIEGRDVIVLNLVCTEGPQTIAVPVASPPTQPLEDFPF